MLTLPAVGLVCPLTLLGEVPGLSHSQVLCHQVAMGLTGASALTQLHRRWISFTTVGMAMGCGRPQYIHCCHPARSKVLTEPSSRQAVTHSGAHTDRSHVPPVRARSLRLGGERGDGLEEGLSRGMSRKTGGLSSTPSHHPGGGLCRAEPPAPCRGSCCCTEAAGDTEGFYFFTNKHFGG